MLSFLFELSMVPFILTSTTDSQLVSPWDASIIIWKPAVKIKYAGPLKEIKEKIYSTIYK